MGFTLAVGFIGVDSEENEEIVCCACFEKTLRASEFPDLILATAQLSKPLQGKSPCPKCGRPYLRMETLEAAEHIQQMIKSRE